jgi:hypothetical protein
LGSKFCDFLQSSGAAAQGRCAAINRTRTRITSHRFQGYSAIKKASLFRDQTDPFPFGRDATSLNHQPRQLLQNTNKSKPWKGNIMSIKNLTLAAATLAATASFATVASANSYFEAGANVDSGAVLEIGSVIAESAGVVNLYNTANGVQGALVGSTQINAGLNPDVEIKADRLVGQDVIAVLEVDGVAVATKTLNVAR